MRQPASGGTMSPRRRLDDLPIEVLQRLPVDPRRMQLSQGLARVYHDQAVAEGFAERPPHLRSLADVDHAIDLLERSVATDQRYRDAPLAALTGRLVELPVGERAAGHARIAAATRSLWNPQQALVALMQAAETLRFAEREQARANVLAHRAAPLMLASARADDVVDPVEELPALRSAIADLAPAEQQTVLGRFARAALNLPFMQAHEWVAVAMASHDLPWPPEAAAAVLRRIGWLPPQVQAAFEQLARGEGNR